MRQSSTPVWRTTATLAIAIVTALASLFVSLSASPDAAVIGGAFIPARLDGVPLGPDIWGVPVWLTPLSATLIHVGLLHLGLNLVMLLFSGREVEETIGVGPMLLLYVIGAYAAAAGEWLVSRFPTNWLFASDAMVPMVGASGAISALIGAYALLYGREDRARPIGPLPASLVYAIWLALAWSAINILVAFAYPIAWPAHVGGFIAGLILARPLLNWRWRHA